MKKFIIKDVIKQNAPDFKGLIISADIENTQYNQEFWDRFDLQIKEFADNHKVEDINKIKTINATRNVYKSLGKEPNRYRPSAEALCRRIIKEKSLYKINTLVDQIGRAHV